MTRFFLTIILCGCCLLESGTSVDAKPSQKSASRPASQLGTPERELFKALVKGDTVKATALINSGVRINIRDYSGLTPLDYTIVFGLDEPMQLLLQKGAAVNARNGGGQTPLLTAAQYGRPRAAAALLQRGAKVDARDGEGQTALILAADMCQPEVADVLLRAGADANAADQSGRTPLMYSIASTAAKMGALIRTSLLDKPALGKPKRDPDVLAHENITRLMELLLAHGANPNKEDATGLSAWHLARHRPTPSGCKALTDILRTKSSEEPPATVKSAFLLSDIEELKRALAHGSSPDENAPSGEPALMAAVRGPDGVLWVKALLAKGAHPDVRGSDGFTSLLGAADLGLVDMMELLLNSGADVNLKGAEGRTPLMHACASENIAAIRLLLEHRARVNETDGEGYTALFYANSEPVAELLLKSGADASAVNASGATPLMVLAADDSASREQVAKTLIAHGADVNARGPLGITALCVAIVNGHGKLVPFLLKNGADPNLAQSDGVSPLMLAVLRNDLASVKALLAGKAQVNAISKTGLTALKAAQQRKGTAVIALLKAAGATR